MDKKSKFLYYKQDMLFISLLILIDQVTKIFIYYALKSPQGGLNHQNYYSFFNEHIIFRLLYNTNGIFGLDLDRILPFLPTNVFYFTLLSIAMFFILLAYKKIPSNNKWERTAFIFFIGGGLGNILDRIRIGKVIDFIDINIPNINIGAFELQRWYVFNVADIFICCGFVILLISNFISKKPNKK